MIGPIPGMTRISNGEKRMIRNISQTAAQIARQDTDVFCHDTLAICSLLRLVWAVCADPTAGGEWTLPGMHYFVQEVRFWTASCLTQ
jgi:hypothetical protein